jgi:hypothetical protein
VRACMEGSSGAAQGPARVSSHWGAATTQRPSPPARRSYRAQRQLPAGVCNTKPAPLCRHCCVAAGALLCPLLLLLLLLLLLASSPTPVPRCTPRLSSLALQLPPAFATVSVAAALVGAVTAAAAAAASNHNHPHSSTDTFAAAHTRAPPAASRQQQQWRASRATGCCVLWRLWVCSCCWCGADAACMSRSPLPPCSGASCRVHPLRHCCGISSAACGSPLP